MNSIEVLKSAFEGSHNWYQGTIAGVTAEQANTVPAGVAHPIGELALHILHSEDGMITMMVQGQPMIWERDGWAAKLGVPVMMMQDATLARGVKCNPQDLQDYAQSVYANTGAFLDSLSPDDLVSKTVDMTAAGAGVMKLGDFLVQALLGNNYAHTGEISALKGIMGHKGYPF